MTTTTNNIIRRLRKRVGNGKMTQKQLATAAGYANASTISDFEDERSGPPSNATVDRIAKACGLEVYFRSTGGWCILQEGYKLSEVPV